MLENIEFPIASFDFAEKWKHLIQKVTIPTWTEHHCLGYLCELAIRSNRIIECGTYLGASAKVMLLANPNLLLNCIDTFACKGEPMMMDYLKNTRCGKEGLLFSKPEEMTTGDVCRYISLREFILQGRLALTEGDSQKGAEYLKSDIPDLQVDAIWIDDGHATEDVLRDIRCLLPFLKAGGEMVGHDFDVPHNDVARGVIASGISYDVPIPRMWRHIKKAEDVITVETGYPM